MFDWQRPIGPPDMFARRVPARRQKLVDTMREQVGGQSTDSRAWRAPWRWSRQDRHGVAVGRDDRRLELIGESLDVQQVHR